MVLLLTNPLIITLARLLGEYGINMMEECCVGRHDYLEKVAKYSWKWYCTGM